MFTHLDHLITGGFLTRLSPFCITNKVYFVFLLCLHQYLDRVLWWLFRDDSLMKKKIAKYKLGSDVPLSNSNN